MIVFDTLIKWMIGLFVLVVVFIFLWQFFGDIIVGFFKNILPGGKFILSLI